MKDEERIKILLSILVEHKDDPMIKFLIENREYIKEISNLTYEELKKLYSSNIGYNNYYSVYDSLDIANSYLERLNPNYKKELNDLVNKGFVEFIESDRNTSYIRVKVYDDGRLEPNITISQTHTIDDAYDLVHEYMHYTNVNDGVNLDRRLFTESISILHEFLFYDYLKENNISSSDNNSPIKERINSIIAYCNNLYNGITIYDGSMNHLEELSNIKQESNDKYYEQLLGKTKYAISSMLAIKMYHDYKKGLITIDNINSFNDSIKNNKNLESLNHILINKPNYNEMKEALDYFKNEIYIEKNDIKK